MKVRFTCLIALMCCIAFASTAQIYAVSNGTWDANTGSANNIWSTNKSASSGTVGLRPSSADNVYTNGRTITLGASVACNNLYVEHDIAGSINLGQRVLTIHGFLTAWDSDLNDADFAVADLITYTDLTRAKILFEGTNLASGEYLIDWWDLVATIPSIEIRIGSKSTEIRDPLSIERELKLTSGTITASNSISVVSTLSISSGAILSASQPIDGGSATSKISVVNIAGTLTTASYLNGQSFTVQSGGVFTTSYSGTSGWWSGLTSPGTVNISGNVTYNGGAQAVYSGGYGSLTLSGSGVKTASSGSLTIAGLLSIGSGVTFNTSSVSSVILNGNVSNSGSWSPSQIVRFESSGTQVMSGNAIVFGGGIEVGNPTTTPATVLDLADNLDVNGALSINVNATLDLNDNTLNLSGNLSNSGILTDDGTGLAQVTFDGTTSVSGNSAATLPNVLVSGTLNAPSPFTITRHLTINSGGTYNAGATLNLAGNFSNSGSFSAGSGKVNFNGSSGQSLNGTATFYDMTISNVNTVSAVGTISLAGALTLSGSGKFYAGTGSNFTILSTGLNAGGSIATMGTPANFTGQVTIQRYIDSPADWRYLSVPIKNADVSDLADDITVTGFSSEPCTADGVTIYDCSAASIYEFTSSSQTWTGLTGTTYSNKPLSSLKGYSIWSYLTANTTLDMTGDIEKGDVIISGLNSAAGAYSLIPNPYPSAIDWDGVTNTGFSNNIYLTTSQGNYATYTRGNAVGVNHPDGSWTGQIAMGQSFWIESAGGSSLKLTEAAKVGTYEFVRETTPKDYFKMQLKSATQSDELAIVFRVNATREKDIEFDAVKRANEEVFNFSSYTTDNTLTYAINTIAPIQCNETLKLNLADVAEGQYTIAFSHLDRLELGYDLVLVDKYLGLEKKVAPGVEYTFDISSEPVTYGADRFEIKISSPTVDIARDLQIASTLECNNDYVRIELNNSQQGIQYLFKMGDQNLHEPALGNGASVYAYVNKSQLEFGANSLSLVASSRDGCNAHIFNEAINVQFDAIDEITSVVSGQSCGEGTISLQAAGASVNGSYRWYESQDAVESIAGSSDAIFITPSLSETRSYYVAAVNSNGCESTLRVPVEAKVILNPKPEISLDGEKLLVNAKAGIQWYKDGQLIDGATLPELSMKNTGIYSVSVTKDGCVAHSDTFEFIVNSEVGKSGASDYSLSPNPTSDILYLNGPDLSGVSVRIYDSRGRELHISGTAVNENQLAFDLSNSRNGLYFVNILSNRKLVQLKAIKK